MHAIAFRRMVLFYHRHKQAWISVDASWDYYNLTCSVSIATFLIGFEYVWKTSRNIKKDSIGWEWHPKY